MQIYLSTLTESDYEASLQTIVEAFQDVSESNHDEQELVKRIRSDANYNYELEVVAKNDDGEVVGHILLSEIKIVSDQATYTALALAPLAVLKPYRNQGIGKALVQAGEERVATQDYDTIIVLGDPGYYGRLGYEEAEQYGIYSPFELPSAYFMVKFIAEDAQTAPRGKVVYSDAFNG